MRATIWIIILAFLCIIIGYVVGVIDRSDDREAKDIAYEALQDYCKRLEKDNIEFMKYVPAVIRKKDMIIMMRKMWKTFKEIWEYTGIDKSWIAKSYSERVKNGSV